RRRGRRAACRERDGPPVARWCNGREYRESWNDSPWLDDETDAGRMLVQRRPSKQRERGSVAELYASHESVAVRVARLAASAATVQESARTKPRRASQTRIIDHRCGNGT